MQKELSIADESIRFKFPSKEFSSTLEKYNININIRLFFIQMIYITGNESVVYFLFFGFDNIFVLNGGLQNWINKNYPTSTINVVTNIGNFDKKIKFIEKQNF